MKSSSICFYSFLTSVLQLLEIWDESRWSALLRYALVLVIFVTSCSPAWSLLEEGSSVTSPSALKRRDAPSNNVKFFIYFCHETWTWWFTFIKYSFEESGDIFKTSIKSDLWQHVLDRGALNISGTGRV